MNNININTDKALLDIDYIHQFLNGTYWAKGRTKEAVQRTVDNCVCFGVYKNNQQIGFARVLTDFAVFAYVMDVFIDPAERGNGYATQLMNVLINFPDFDQVKNWRLATNDAHDLYRKSGFKVIAEPYKMMELNKK